MILGKVLYDRDWFFVSFFKRVVYFFGTFRLLFGRGRRSVVRTISVPLLVKKDGAFLCNACGLCETACPSHCIEVVAAGEGKLKNFYLDLRRCIQCRICGQVCPEGALEMDAPFSGDIFGEGRVDKDGLVFERV